MNKFKSKADELRQKKKELGEAEEYIKQIEKLGSEEGRKFVVDQVKEDEKKEKVVRDDIRTQLQTKQRQHFSYRRELANYGNWLVEEIKEEGWEIEYVPTDGTRIKIYTRDFETKEGIQLIIKDPKQNVYARGFTTTYVPEYDETAIKTLYVQAENVMDSYKGLLLSDKKKPDLSEKNGIILK